MFVQKVSEIEFPQPLVTLWGAIDYYNMSHVF